MGNPEIEFIGWEKSAVELVGEKLLEMERKEPDAFCRALVVVPTAESGRRLKEWIAEKAGRPLLMPRMKMVGQLIQGRGEDVASEPETLTAWVEVLTGSTMKAAWREFFPRPEQENQVYDWALRTADRLMQLQKQMEQYEVTIEGLLNRLGGKEGMAEDFVERWEALKGDEERRWEALKALFAAVENKLAEWGKRASWKARQEWLARVAESTKDAPTLILACLPELSPQVCRYVRAYAGQVRIWVNAPEELREGFDAYGSVNTDYWAERHLPDLLKEESLHIETSAQGLARAALVATSKDAAKRVTLAACDTSFTPAIVTEFAKYGWKVHVPEGRSFQVSALAALPEALSEAICADKLTWSKIEPMLRNEAVQRLAGGNRFDSYSFGKLLDKIRERYIPDSMGMLLKYLNPAKELPGRKWEVADIAELRREEFYLAVKWLDEYIKKCSRNIYHGLRTLEARLLRIYRGEALDHAARQMAAKAKVLAYFLQKHPRETHEAWAIVKHLLGKYKETLLDTPREQTHVEALGWRELTYAEGEVLVLTGLHEGCVPEPLPADPFLPNTLREALGMPCTRSREARDCYLLSALLSRKNVEVSIILSRSTADGTGSPVEASPLLYHCDMETLVKRVQHLYKDLGVDEAADEYGRWSLAPKELKAAEGDMESVTEQLAPTWKNPFAAETHRFSPSKINKFLECPLRFWMKHALGIDPWETYKEDKADLEAAEYGSLIHAALEDVGNNFGTKETVMSVDEMYEYAMSRLYAHAEAHYGRPTPPVLVKHQILSFCNKSLRPFLEWHRKQIIEEGWECYACEHKVNDWELALPNGQVAHIAMRADRIDYHPESGKWRIIDYKTHERTPKSDHLEVVKQVELWNEKMGADRFPLFDATYGKQGIRPHRWKDVQLPMYAYWLMQEKKCGLPEVAYYNLPRNRKDEPKYNTMKELDEAALESALTWAKNAIILMREGKCLYSAESLGCKAHGSYSENENLADPRSLFHTLKPVTLSQHEPCHE